jgi:hypothetical protein
MVTRVPRWRVVAAAAVLAALAFFLMSFAPLYIRNLRLQNFVAGIPQRVENQAQSGSPPSDDVLRDWVLDRAHGLGLPVKAGNIRIQRSPATARVEGIDVHYLRVDRIDVHYLVRVDLPGYTVNLHFYPGAGSR